MGSKAIVALCAIAVIVLLAVLVAVSNLNGYHHLLAEGHAALREVVQSVWVGVQILFWTALVLGVAYVGIHLKHKHKVMVVGPGKHGAMQALVKQDGTIEHLNTAQAQIDPAQQLLLLEKILKVAAQSAMTTKRLSSYIEEDPERTVDANAPQRSAPPQIDKTGQQNTLLTLPYPEATDFAHVLATGWRPTPEQIFLFNTVNGVIYDAMESTCHIGLAGPTGGGKTNTLRLILPQFLYCGADVYLANPNFAPIKLNGRTIEDWRPIVAAMKRPVAWQMEDIKKLIGNAANRLNERRANQQYSPMRGRDIYLALGEWPAIQSRWDKAAEPVSQLLRESRQYGIHVISEFQDALVRTLGMSGGVRECFRNAYYFGGDATTARTMLDLQGKGPLDEGGLGELGASLFRTNTKPAVRGRVPFMSNRALYMLLGEPQNPLPDRLPEGVNPAEFFRSYGIPVFEQDGDIMGTNGDAEKKRYYPGFESPTNLVTTVVDAAQEMRRGPITGDLEKSPNRLIEGLGTVPNESPMFGPDDRQFDSDQVAEFTKLYKAFGNIKECLRRMNGGQGLSNRYNKHAAQIVEQYKLRRS